MHNNENLKPIKALLLCLLLLSILSLLLAYKIYQKNTSDKASETSNSNSNSKATGYPAEHRDNQVNATKQNNPSDKKLETIIQNIAKEESTEGFRLNIDYIYQTLANINLNKEGQLVLGREAKALLEGAFRGVRYDFTEAELEQIASLIKIGLPGEAGVQAATIVLNYYHYKAAETDLIAQFDTTDIHALQSNYEQLIATRVAHLGYDVNQQLFGEEQRQQQYMISAMLLQNDTSLTESERTERQAALKEKYQQ